MCLVASTDDVASDAVRSAVADLRLVAEPDVFHESIVEWECHKSGLSEAELAELCAC